MANTTGALPENTVAEPTGLITKLFDWALHPAFADTDWRAWLAFLVLIAMANLLWSKVIKQTLDAVL